MVNIRYLSLIICLLLLVNGCAIQTTTTPAQVEDRSRPQGQKAPAETTVKAPQPSAAEDMQKPADDSKPVPAESKTEMVEQPSPPVADTERMHQSGPAVVALLDDADKFSGQGNNQQAIASVERALRIEPKNPVLWNRLGRLHLQNGSWIQAITMAKKSNVLATGNRELQADNWQIMARARQGLGDAAGANEALKKARELDR